MKKLFLKKMALTVLATVLALGSFTLTADAFNQSQLDRLNNGEKNCAGFDLSGAYLFRPNLNGVNLSGANLSKIQMAWGTLQQCNFSGANLSGAQLTNARLEDCNFRNANLQNADLSGAFYINVTWTDGTVKNPRVYATTTYTVLDDLTGQPLPKANYGIMSTNIHTPNTTGLTDARGQFTVKDVQAGTPITIAKDGYDNLLVAADENAKNMSVRLKRSPVAVTLHFTVTGGYVYASGSLQAAKGSWSQKISSLADQNVTVVPGVYNFTAQGLYRGKIIKTTSQITIDKAGTYNVMLQQG